MLAEMGVLLLAYYFPHVYDNAAKRTETKKQSIDQSIFEITGLSPINLSLEALHSLNLPVYYKTLFQVAIGKPDKSIKTLPANEREEIERSAGALKAAMVVSAAVCQDDGKHELDLALEEVVAGLSIEENRVRTLVGELPAAFVGHCSLLEADLPPLPDFVASYAATEEEAAIATGKESDIFQKFVDEIRQSVDNHEPTATVITSVMETLAWGLKFDRVVLLLVSPTRNALVGRMGLGKIDGVEPKKISRPIGAGTPTKASDVQAFSESRPVYQGTPLLEGGWPFAAIPVGSRAKSIGVIYADRVQSKDMELTSKEKAALGILVDLLDRSVAMQ
jgi:hypothetical protein